jgi:pimeloyl-ACP methyl ester carboxylesterase
MGVVYRVSGGGRLARARQLCDGQVRKRRGGFPYRASTHHIHHGCMLNARVMTAQGYSNGCLPTSLHLPLPQPMRTSHIFISYPLDVRGWLSLFNGRTYEEKLEALVNNPNSRVLVVYGDHDEFTGVSSYEKWARKLERISEGDEQTHARGGSGPPKPQINCHSGGSGAHVVRIDGGSHFWRGDDLTRMVAAIETFLRDH